MRGKQPKSAVIYARVSPSPDVETSDSVNIQIEICKEFCEKNGYAVASIHSDKGFSGSNADRPGLWNAIDSLKRDNVLVVFMLDRLARGVYLTYELERQIKAKNASVISTSGEGTWKDTPADKMIRGILIIMAEFERSTKNARTSAHVRRQMAMGKVRCDPKRLPYGWKLDLENTASMIQDDYEQEVIKEILYYAADGKDENTGRQCKGASLRQIAATLNESGRKSRQGLWTHAGVHRVLDRIKRLSE